MFKRILGIVIAYTVIFSLAACNNDFDLADYKVKAKTEIANYAIESNYCPDNWNTVCDIVDAGKQAVDIAEDKAGVDTAVADAKVAIDAVEECKEVSDFVLTISTDKTILLQDEDFKVNVELKNSGEHDFEISFSYGFIAHIPNFIDFFDPNNPKGEIPEPQTMLMERGGILLNIDFWGTEEKDGILIANRLSKGTHELSFHFEFGANGQRQRIWSNKIILTVQ